MQPLLRVLLRGFTSESNIHLLLRSFLDLHVDLIAIPTTEYNFLSDKDTWAKS